MNLIFKKLDFSQKFLILEEKNKENSLKTDIHYNTVGSRFNNSYAV